MIDLMQACEIAIDYYLKNTNKKYISKIYEHQDMWIIFGISDEIEYGGCGISIDKNTGKISMFSLPSEKNFEIIDSSIQCQVPAMFANVNS